MKTNFYVKVDFPTYFLFWGPFLTFEKAETFSKNRPGAASGECRIVEVRSETTLPTGVVIGYAEPEGTGVV